MSRADSHGVTVILNCAAGSAGEGLAEDLRVAFRQCGAEANVICATDGAGVEAAAREAASAPGEIVAAAGGDGTLGAVAGELVGTEKIFAVLPMGTLNHFAKDLHIPLDLAGAVRTAVSGRTATIDVGEVNGRIFLNNSSLGIYPRVVEDRQKQQAQTGRSKWHAFARAAFDAFRRYPFLQLRITTDGRGIDRETAFLFIGNNEYEFSGLRAGGRGCLNAGHLGLYLAHRTGRLGILRLSFQALLGRLAQAKDFETFCVDEATVETRRRHVLVATDGEVNRMQSPLRYRIRRGALRVRVPAESSLP